MIEHFLAREDPRMPAGGQIRMTEASVSDFGTFPLNLWVNVHTCPCADSGCRQEKWVKVPGRNPPLENAKNLYFLLKVPKANPMYVRTEVFS